MAFFGGFGVWGFRVWASLFALVSFAEWGLGLKVAVLGFKVEGSRFRAQGLGLKV